MTIPIIEPDAKRPAASSVDVFVAACTGSSRIMAATNLPLLLVGVSRDAEAAVARLNARRHGSWTIWPRSFQPLVEEDGWSDWELFDMDHAAGPPLSWPPGAVLADGCIRLLLPNGVSVAEIGEQLAAALRPLRFHDVVRRPGWLAARNETLSDLVVHPRYTLATRKGRIPDFRSARLVTDLYVFNPLEHVPRLLWLAGCASFATTF